MYTNSGLYIGMAEGERIYLQPSMANRHGLIAGASGTGKSITMKVLAESFSDGGVPVFLCDIKGDISGLAQPGVSSESMEKRIDRFGIRDEFSYKGYPVTFWDIYQEAGHPIRATVSDLGPDLLSNILGLTDAQTGVLNIIFKIADDNGLHLIDLKDLRAMLNYVGEHKKDYINTYGNIVSQSIGGILRALLPLESQGGDLFLGEPDLDIMDWIRTDPEGKGMINMLNCVKLVQNPALYASFMLWLMSELFERLPEAGDMDKPKIVFFFDEAHMLFTDAPKLLVQKVEQLVKLIRSKGVGIYFITQSPSDIPDGVLAQLSNRVQHALRAYTPAEQKAVRAAANSLRANPAFKTEDIISQLGVGEALISVLDENGVPGIVQNAKVICPQSLMGPCDESVRAAAVAADGMSKYDEGIDRDSAYEMLDRQKEKDEEAAKLAAEREAFEKEKAAFEAQKKKEEEAAAKKREKEEAAAAKKLEREEERRQKAIEQRKKQIERQIINSGAQILKRGIMNTLMGKKR